MVAASDWPWEFGYGDHIAADLGVTKIPLTLFIDRDGVIHHTQTGYMDKQEFVYQLERIL